MERLRRPRLNGRRGAFLLLWGGVYLTLGMVYATQARLPSLLNWYSLPPWTLAAMWIIAGLLAVAGAWMRRPKDAVGYAALIAAPGLWAMLYGVTMVVDFQWTAPIGLAIYLGMAGMVLIVSGMEGPGELRARMVEEARSD